MAVNFGESSPRRPSEIPWLPTLPPCRTCTRPMAQPSGGWADRGDLARSAGPSTRRRLVPFHHQGHGPAADRTCPWRPHLLLAYFSARRAIYSHQPPPRLTANPTSPATPIARSIPTPRKLTPFARLVNSPHANTLACRYWQLREMMHVELRGHDGL